MRRARIRLAELSVRRVTIELDIQHRFPFKFASTVDIAVDKSLQIDKLSGTLKGFWRG